MRKISFFFLLLFVFTGAAFARPVFRYTLRVEEPGKHLYHVIFHLDGIEGPVVDLKMPAWMPGYYQLLNYAGALSGFTVRDGRGDSVAWERTDRRTWRVAMPGKGGSMVVEYTIFANTAFAAQSLLDSTHGFVAPTGMFLYPDGYLRQPVTLEVDLRNGWEKIATGLDTVAGGKHVYRAPDFDVLYDSPILMGELEELPSFTVKGVPHYFVGYRMGEFDRVRFMNEMKKVIEAAVEMIGDIPYRHYTFLGMGSGRGGIEHLNSTAVPFSGNQLSTDAGRKRVFNFLAHEYFHHYNVKRIRPIALGPFDYQGPNHTNLLWVSEGLSVYYEYRLVRLAGLMADSDLLQNLQKNIAAYETKPGRLRQSLAAASWETWDYGPMGGSADSSISVYDKGPAVGLLLDLAIRHSTGNQRSLDDVMRRLYREFYQGKKRGFTDAEFRQVCESVAGVALPEIFEYVYTVKEPDYAKYLAYGGMGIDEGFRIHVLADADVLQSEIRKSLLGK
jgi:predicted metalloprotease with PDZ domain